MKISKTHQSFFDCINQLDVLTNPEKYLGPNWRDVLNFWIYIDTLSDQDKEEIVDRYWNLYEENLLDYVWDTAEEVVGREFRDDVWCAAGGAHELEVFGWITLELIGLHRILEQNKTPLVLQYCVKP